MRKPVVELVIYNFQESLEQCCTVWDLPLAVFCQAQQLRIFERDAYCSPQN